MARAASPLLSQKFVDEWFHFNQTLTGTKSLPPRWKRCVRFVDGSMGEALAQPFVKETLGDDGKRAAASEYFARSLGLCENVAPQSDLAAVILFAMGKLAEASGEIDRALDLVKRSRSLTLRATDSSWCLRRSPAGQTYRSLHRQVTELSSCESPCESIGAVSVALERRESRHVRQERI